MKILGGGNYMKSKLKRLIALTMIMVMATALTGCKSDSTKETGKESNETKKPGKDESSSKDKEIIFWNIGTESPDKDIMAYAVDKFNLSTESGYKITNVPTQNDSYKEKLVIAMSSGECPDMYTSWTGGPMNEYIDSGFAQPIDELFEGSDIKDKIMDAGIAQGTYKDHLYALPVLNVAISGVYYNTEIFDKYNLKAPTTVSELEKVCDTLVKNKIVPFALANSSKWTGSMYFMNLAARKGGLEPFADAVAGTGSFEDECFIYAGEKLQEWVGKGYFPEGVNSLSEDDGQAKQMMYQESAAMLLCGSWYGGTFKNDSPEFYEKIDWFSFPKVDDSDADASIQIGTVGDQFISFNCKDEKLAAAFECVEYYSSDEAVQFMIEKEKIPPIKGTEAMIKDPVTKKILEAANGASSTQLWYDQYLDPAVAQVHLDTCQELFGLTIKPKEAAEKFQAEMKAYLAKQ
jgi:raffinose/stachyose/melibiose transport system substrate-binding protein